MISMVRVKALMPRISRKLHQNVEVILVGLLWEDIQHFVRDAQPCRKRGKIGAQRSYALVKCVTRVDRHRFVNLVEVKSWRGFALAA
jgi:hypothetical protein